MAPLRRVLQHHHHLHDRRVIERALGMQRIHELFERQILGGRTLRDPFPHTSEQLYE